jgi:hypothetical protein
MNTADAAAASTAGRARLQLPALRTAGRRSGQRQFPAAFNRSVCSGHPERLSLLASFPSARDACQTDPARARTVILATATGRVPGDQDAADEVDNKFWPAIRAAGDRRKVSNPPSCDGLHPAALNP